MQLFWLFLQNMWDCAFGTQTKIKLEDMGVREFESPLQPKKKKKNPIKLEDNHDTLTILKFFADP